LDCPSCHNEVDVLERNYGALFTCPKCQAVYFINFEGIPEYGEVPQAYTSESESLDSVEADALSGYEEPELPTAEYSFEMATEAFELTQRPEEEVVSEFTTVAQDIADFGNSEVQISALNYDLEVYGLDSKDDIQIFKEALQDSRFGWDVAEKMKEIRNGLIRIEKLNPVQAYVLAKRIHFLGLETKWTQYALE